MIDNLDVAAFWLENERCLRPFCTDKDRAPLVMIFEDHFLLRLLGPTASAARYYGEPEYALGLHAKANDILGREIGLRPYSEDAHYYIKGAFEVRMGARRVIREGSTPWLESGVQDIEDVKKLIARAEKWDARRDAIPEEWLSAKAELMKNTGKRLLFCHMPNGPATMACNLLGTTNLCIFMMEEPDVMDAFFGVAARKAEEFIEGAMLEDGGGVLREGFCVNDDNCYLFPPAQYERFCAPFLARLFGAFAPEKHHLRRQHSDSAMGHLMGILNGLGVNEVNLGPEIHPADIRKAMPKAVIHGQLPPFVLRNGTHGQIAEIVKRDFESVGGDGSLVESVAGVVPESTPMDNIRAYMLAVQRHTRYR